MVRIVLEKMRKGNSRKYELGGKERADGGLGVPLFVGKVTNSDARTCVVKWLVPGRRWCFLLWLLLS